jgi:hypothetical protein
MAELVSSGSRKISELTLVSGISGSTAIPIVMGGNTVQISHSDFLTSTVFSQPNTFTEINEFTIEQRIINNGSVTDLTGDGIIIREDIVSGPPTYGFRISSSMEEILFQDIVTPIIGNPFNTFLKIATNADDISILRNTSIDGNLIVSGGITAELINVNLVSSSIVYSSGSNIFGNTVSNTHQFTGSLRVTGSANVIGGFTQTSGVVSFGGAATFNNAISTFNQGINIFQTASFFGPVNIGASGQTRNLLHFGNYNHTGNTIQTGSINVTQNVIASSFTGSLSYTNLNNIPNGIVSSSTQINQYNIFATTGSNGFVGNQNISGDVIVTGSLIVSGSNTFRNIGRAEFTGSFNVNGGITVTQSITASVISGSFVGDGSSLSGVTAADVDFVNVLNKPTLVSGSSQIDLTGTTNYVSGIKTRLNAETVVSSSQQIKTLLPTGTVSGSSQVSFNGIVDKPTLFSSSIQVNADTITNFDANVLAYNNSLGVVSGSSQVSFNGIVDKPTLVSGSSQITYSGISSIPTGIVSSSTQVLNYGIFATTGSNIFKGNQTISGSFLVSGSTRQIGNNTLDGNTILSGSINISGSTVQIGNTTLIGDNTITGSNSLLGNNDIVGTNNILGDTLMSGSLAISASADFNGDVNINGSFYVSGSKQFNRGQFYHTATLSGSADTAYPFQFNTTDTTVTNGTVYVDNDSRIYVVHSGVYNIQFSAQLRATTNDPIEFSIWFAMTGSNIMDSNSDFSIAKTGGGGNMVAALNYLMPIESGSYIELYYSKTRTDGEIQAKAAQTTPTRPATPSVILTVTQTA